MSDNLKIPFKPVRGKDENIQAMTTQNGYLYLATDTRKVYLGMEDEGEKLLMGYDTGIFYGKKEIPADNSGNPLNPTVYFNLQEIEGNRLPLNDDLILNIDGCFYRVDAVVDTENVKTTRLTLQGTGGGGSSDGSGGSSFNISFSNKSKNFVFSTEATSMDISFISFYNGDDDNYLSAVSFYLGSNTDPFYTTEVNKDGEALVFNKTHTIDLIDYKHLFGPTNTTVKVAIYDKYGVDRSDEIKIRMVTIAIKQVDAALLYTTTTSLGYTCFLEGATSGVKDKKLIYKFYKESTPDELDGDPITMPLNASDEGNLLKNLDLSRKEHGVYILKVQASATIDGTVNTIYSNELTHKVGYFTENGEPLLMVLAPAKTEQYTNIPVEYLFVTSESGQSYTLDIKLNNQAYKSLDIKSNTLGKYNFYFEDKGAYEALFTVVEAGVFKTLSLYISAYTGNLPVIDPTRDDLMLYLTPRGKTNSGTDRAEWADYNGRHVAKISGLHYGSSDGWLMDTDGTTYLKLTSGAAMTLDSFKPFQYDLTKKEGDNPGLGMTIELDFEITGILDYDTPSITCVSYDQNKVVPQCGFEVVGDKVKMYNSRLNGQWNPATNAYNGVLANQTIVEGKRMRLSFVVEPQSTTYPLCYTYLNGKISGAVKYTVGTDEFKDGYYPATLKVDSSAAQIKIYGIRFYNNALQDKVILNNYTASFSSIADRQANYDTNNVLNASGDVSFTLVADEEYNLQIPYMKLTGGYNSISKDDKWTLAETANLNAGLPTGKKDYRLVDVEVVYPDNEFFKGYEPYSFVNDYGVDEQGNKIPMAQAGGKKPLNGGMIMYAQGTSSMEYPVKNLRLRAKKEKNYYTVKTDIAPVEIICMKADYMESSGSHNTGTANFVDDLYKSANISTPGQDHFGGEGKDRIVTCIKGHPCLIFYSASPEGPYEYIGKYNFNLDKATPEPFGFNHDDSDFGYLGVGEPYYAVEYDDEGEAFIGQEKPTKGGDYNDSAEGEELKYVQEGEKINSIHCFEFLDNAVKVCNFLNRKLETALMPDETPPSQNSIYTEASNVTSDTFNQGVHYIKNADGKYEAASSFVEGTTYYTVTFNYEETWYNTVWDTKEKRYAPGWTLGFESRYPEDRLGYHDADMLWPLASWLHELYNLRYGYEGVTADPDQALARFKNEYECYLDKDFLLTYYLVTEALLMADSRVKNMMIATWNKAKKSYKPLKKNTEDKWVVDDAATPVETNNYIFYPIFYDMDTMLGLDNTGAARFNYYDEDTDPAVYNGDEVLWNFVRDALPTELITWYSHLETGLMNASDILPYYNDNQANMANEAFYNGDAKYKYVIPFRTGYYDGLNEKDIKPGEAPYLYAAQGDRSLSRESFINNRIRFLRGKYVSDKFQKNDRIVYRQNCPAKPAEPPVLDANETDENLLEQRSAYYVPSDGLFQFTSLKTGYSGVQLGANGATSTKRFDGEQTQTIAIDTSSASGTEAYILGLSTLSDMGDLSTKYMQKFIMESSDIRLRKLILGSPHKYYYNRYWNTVQGGQSPEITLGGFDTETGEPYGCLYLEEFNLQNCNTFNNVLDFRVCSAIEKIYLTGSGVSGVTLPTNGLLTELRLPPSVTTIRIEGHGSLTDRGFSVGTYDYNGEDTIGVYEQAEITQEIFEANPDLYFINVNEGTDLVPQYEFAPNKYSDRAVYYTEVGHYVNDFTNVRKLYVTGTPINTYAILKDASQLSEYYLHNIAWNIDEVEADRYCKRDASWKYIDEDGKEMTLGQAVPSGYYIYNNNSQSYIPYESTEYPEGEFLFEKFSMLNENGEMVCIPTLEWLQTISGMDDAKHSEALAGTIHINLPEQNGEKVKVTELDIYDRYASVFPNITITYGDDMAVEGASRINFYRIDSITMEGMDIKDVEPYFFSLTAQGAKSLGDIIADASFVNPVKNATVGNTYTFTGRWIDWNDANKTVYYQDSKTQDGFKKEDTDVLFSGYKPSSNMNLVPIFKEETRQYQVTLYDYDGTTVLTSAYIDYEEYVGTFFENNVNTNSAYTHAYYNYREWTDEAKPDSRWAFKGWQSATDWKGGASEATYTDLNGRQVLSDVVFYAFYKEENVYTDISMISSKNDFFNYKEGYTINGVTGAQISLKDKYRYLLQGKITLPVTSPSGTPIISIGDFSAKHSEKETYSSTYFTHIYFKDSDTASYIEVSENAFAAGSGPNDRVNTGLTAVYLPPSITILNNGAFRLVSSLRTVTLTDNLTTMGNSVFWDTKNVIDIGLDELPVNLKYIGTSSCYNAGPGIKATKLPVGLTDLQSYIFAGCSSVNLTTLGSEGAPITSMATTTLDKAGNGTVSSLEIYCMVTKNEATGETKCAIPARAFESYNTATIGSLTIHYPTGFDDFIRETYGSWGLNIADDANLTFTPF